MIFDWSGTLVDDLPAVWRSTNFVLSQGGLSEITLDTFRSEFSLPFTGFYQRYLPHVPMEQLETWFHGHFRTVQDLVIELPHAREFLVFCRDKGLRTFVLSTVHRDHFANQAAVTGLGEFIDRPYLGVWDKREKIHAVLAENKLAPDETLFVGDMQHDIETAHHGGVHSCAVLTGYNSLPQLRSAEPDLIVEHLGELRHYLERHGLEMLPPSRNGEPAQPYPVVTVGALIFDNVERVLMIRTQKWSNLWGIPGGKVKYGETQIAALRRELAEETGLEVTDIHFVLAQDCIDSPEFYRAAHFLLLNYTCRVTSGLEVRLNEEAQEYRWVSIRDALKMPLNQPTQILIEAVVAGWERQTA